MARTTYPDRRGALMRLLAALCIWIGASAAIYLLLSLSAQARIASAWSVMP